MAKLPTPQELIASRPEFPSEPWLDIKPQFAPGSFCYPAKKETMELLHMPNPHDWDPAAEDWNLPENWEQILCDAFEERLQKHRSLKLFMDICVRCGACADKCHFFLGTNDPKNMPVLRAELLRSLYRRDYTKLGKILGRPPQMKQFSNSVPLIAATMSRNKGSPSPPGSFVLSSTAIFLTVLGITLKRYLLDQGL